LLKAVEAAARCDVRVLLEGQSGTGKELIARAIHKLSTRKDHPFVAVDCGAIPENLAESELFGHMKGSFTGATQDHRGLIEEAHGGTLFMDEIANLRSDTQAKLLRVLQEGEFRPLGGNQPRKVDVRIISASSAPLQKLVGQHQFRQDLYFRLHVYPIHVPSLNERREDILPLADSFVCRFAQAQKKQTESFRGSLLQFMQRRKWLGNIRELENFIERLVTLAPPDMKVLDSTILPPELEKEFKTLVLSHQIPLSDKPLEESLAELEEQLIRKALAGNDWNQSRAARALHISERAMRYKMEKLGISKSRD
jgi:DNA-binding NtrC family response regulator